MTMGSSDNIYFKHSPRVLNVSSLNSVAVEIANYV